MLPRFLPLVFGAIVLTIISAALGYNLGQRGSSTQTTPGTQSTFFNSQSATVRGNILSLNGSTLEIKNLKGAVEKFELLKGATIAKFDNNRKLSSPSADLKLLELNKEAIFTLRRSGDLFKVAAINYLP